ncbi:c-type cytochrome [Candidatus Thiosymbion oneisti]|uniref:c-type cytochrome n=1 Tax=Candidatus Thiosymbion oneisti TaxID=589554 RepID=UPI001A9C52E8|nr:c-type cytochrome [Candidatus Thiosymbion oneisti]
MGPSKLVTLVFGTLFTCAAVMAVTRVAAAPKPRSDANTAAQDAEMALRLTPNPERGREIYLMCAVCHQPEGWGTADGLYPQIAGQLYPVIIKQMADIRAGNRDTPTMFPFTMLDVLGLQQLADVAAYVSRLPMNPNNSVGPGTDLEKGERLYREYCLECHGAHGEGIADEHAPLIQGQHYPYLVRQFEWIAQGKRRNADAEMVEQIKGFSAEDISAIMDYTSRLSPPPARLAQPGWTNPDFAEFVRTPRLQDGG